MIVLFSILCLFIAIPTSFAMDNDSIIGDDNLSNADYYFNASVENDSGNGSIDNPYKELKSNRINDNSNIHLANGRYRLDSVCNSDNVNIIGSDPEKTFVSFGGVGFTSGSSITLTNVTFLSLAIQNYKSITATNTIFRGFSSSINSVINSKNSAIVYLKNCTFEDINGNIGGAINIQDTNLTIIDSKFININSNLFGGAIYCTDHSNVVINNSEFVDVKSKSEAGGAIYLFNSFLVANNIDIINCSATFGAGITSLSSDLSLTNLRASNNKAKYYGGAIYSMYRTFSIFNSYLENNSASNGGALYVDNVGSFQIFHNKFVNNVASCGDAVYSLVSDFYYDSIYDDALNNTFINNDAYVSNTVNLNIGNNKYVLFKVNSSSGKLPSSYDLRDLNQVTSVKNQGNGGNCWAFSAVAALESSILKAGGEALDLSEENMKNIMSLYSNYGWAMETNVGGYDKMAIGYLTSWLGPVYESEDEYYSQSTLSPIFDSFMHVQNILFLTRDNCTDNNAIKKAIMDYGAVSTSAHWSKSYINGKNYYYNGKSDANHAVVIVGWDDNYDKSNFINKPEGNGAWIIKNSWGSSGEDKGFFYVSYYDTKFAQPGRYVSYAFVLNDTMKFDKSYQYDIPGRTDYLYNLSSTVWYKNIFKATGDEYLAGVSTYFDKETKWDLFVYVNNALKLTQSGVAYPSYSTINLNQLIPLKLGDTFEVVFKIKVDGDAGVPISEKISFNNELYKEGISYISYDGKKWDDLYYVEGTYPDHVYYSQVACIKAFSVFEKIDTRVVLEVTNLYNPVEIVAKVFNEYGGKIESGIVTFNLDGKTMNVKVVGGVAKLNYVFRNIQSNLITATYNGVGFNSNRSSITTDVNEVYIIANDLSTYLGDLLYNASLIDKFGKPVAGKKICFNVNDKNYVSQTDKNGIATVSFKFSDVGDYIIKMGLQDDSNIPNFTLSKNIQVKSTINLSSKTKFTLNSIYSADLVNANGDILKNSQVNVIVDSTTYNLFTDDKGILNYNVNLTPGSYDISIVNVETGEVKSQVIDVVARITSNKNISMYYGAGKEYKVRINDDYGDIAKGVKVKFNINGKTYTRTTDDKGYASFKINLAPNTYTITATYKKFTVSNKVVVKPTLITKDASVKKSKTLTFTAKLLDNNGKILKNKQIVVKFKGKTYKVKTNTKGIATFKIKLNSKIGKFAITTSYGNLKVTNTITVKK